MICPQCGVELPANALACPSCRALVHAVELKTLAAAAESATASGNYSGALVHWRRALELLPPTTAQHGVITSRVNELVQRLESPTAAELPKKPKWAEGGGILGAIGLVLWKFKFITLFLLTKGKLLLLGLTKAGTLWSMLLSLGVYWQIFGWQLGLGLVLSIYVHEMGHIYQLHRYGIKATVPMFIPGLGALIRQKQYPVSAHEDARVGLAGPMWGLAACGVTYAIYLATRVEIIAAIAQWAAFINLFNLLPVWQLDGSHAFRALSRWERAAIAAIMLVMSFVAEQPFLLILVIVAGFRCFEKTVPQKSDLPIFSEFAFLVVTLALLTKIPVDVERKQPAVASVALISIAAESRTFAEARPGFGRSYGRRIDTSPLLH